MTGVNALAHLKNKTGSKELSTLLAGLGQNKGLGKFGSRPRAPWRFPQEFKKFLNQGVCIRCTKAGNSSKFCPTFRSAPRPVVNVNYADVLNMDDLISGKEDPSKVVFRGTKKVECVEGKINLSNMRSTTFLIDCLINNCVQTQSLVDTSCLCYSVFDANFLRLNNLLTKEIKPRPLRLANGVITEMITEITEVDLEIKGKEQKICSYVVPSLTYSIILGKP